MSVDEHKIINGNKNLVICFGGMALKFGGILPFEFLNYLSSIYSESCDLIFYIDTQQCWYHRGIRGITNNIQDTVAYLNSVVSDAKYEKVIFMGTSAGGYGAILFGSLCDNVDNVVAFIPQTIIKDPVDVRYSNLRNVINDSTVYFLYGDKSIEDEADEHHISHCENIGCFPNVDIIKGEGCNMKKLRDEGFIKEKIDSVIYQV